MQPNNFVFKNLTKEQIEKINHFFNEHQIKNNNQNIIAMFKINKFTISIYKSKTLLIQGPIENLEKNILNFFSLIKIDLNSNLEQKSETEITDSFNIIGSDEVGVGEYIGPIVCCAVELTNQTYQFAKEIKVNDSKKMSQSKIMTIGKQLIENVNYKYKLIEPIEYNDLIEKKLNSHHLKTYGHFIVHNQLLISNKIHIIDGYTNENGYLKYYNDLKREKIINDNFFDVLLIQNGESKFLSIACASIIAKYYWYKWFEQKESELKLDIKPKTHLQQINNAKIIYNLYGSEKLKEIVKLHFNDSKKLF